ncbi:MAG: hypothetical protein OXB84_05520 [Halobacteriovoraceae bacterium]|nr:hypothetical protein [Halobacteriovoraceae bacterium]
MFYIKIFYQILFKNIVMGIFFILTSICLLMAPEIKKNIEYQLSNMIPKTTFKPHFLALLSNTDKDVIAKRFTHLPGIDSVDFLKKEEIEKENKKIIKRLNLKDGGALLDDNFIGIRVYFADKTNQRVRLLIRDYLKELVGPANITMGDILQKEQKDKYLDTFYKYRYQVMGLGWGVVFLFWFLVFLKIRNLILEESYLIEKFQRRNLVGMKVYLAGMASMALLMVLLTRFSIHPHVVWPFLLQIICMFLLTKYKWERI